MGRMERPSQGRTAERRLLEILPLPPSGLLLGLVRPLARQHYRCGWLPGGEGAYLFFRQLARIVFTIRESVCLRQQSGSWFD